MENYRRPVTEKQHKKETKIHLNKRIELCRLLMRVGKRGVALCSRELNWKIHGSRELNQTLHESRTIQRLILLFTHIVEHSNAKLTCQHHEVLHTHEIIVFHALKSDFRILFRNECRSLHKQNRLHFISCNSLEKCACASTISLSVASLVS